MEKGLFSINGTGTIEPLSMNNSKQKNLKLYLIQYNNITPKWIKNYKILRRKYRGNLYNFELFKEFLYKTTKT